MLHSLIIMTGAGVTIFEKTWVDKFDDKGGKSLYGSLITGMQEFSKQSTGMMVSYIEFGNVAISIEIDSRTKLICTLFHDIEDGSDFGKIVVGSILRSFIETFSEVNFKQTTNVGVFASFSGKLYDAISSSIVTILQQLQTVRGVSSSLLCFDDGSPAITPVQDDDQLGIVANLQPLVTASSDVMMERNERVKMITLELGVKVVSILRVTDANLVCICRKNVHPSVYGPAIEKAAVMLEKVFSLAKNLGRI